MLVHVHADAAGVLKARTHIQTGPLTSGRHGGIAEDLQKEAFSETGQQMARNLMMSKTLRRTRKLGHDVTLYQIINSDRCLRDVVRSEV